MLHLDVVIPYGFGPAEVRKGVLGKAKQLLVQVAQPSGVECARTRTWIERAAEGLAKLTSELEVDLRIVSWRSGLIVGIGRRFGRRLVIGDMSCINFRRRASEGSSGVGRRRGVHKDVIWERRLGGLDGGGVLWCSVECHIFIVFQANEGIWWTWNAAG